VYDQDPFIPTGKSDNAYFLLVFFHNACLGLDDPDVHKAKNIKTWVQGMLLRKWRL
jgi:hypothetical protein